MNREQFDHVIRAAADIVDDEIVVIGSQAILAEFPDAPEGMLVSMELDVYPLTDPERADEIDGAIGDGSRFHDTYNYYAHGVGPETPVAPAGWEERLVRIELPPINKKMGSAKARCMSACDLVQAKHAAGRSRDIEFAEQALCAGLVDAIDLRTGIDLLPATHREKTRARLEIVIARTQR
jgi:hypothetical protein